MKDRVDPPADLVARVRAVDGVVDVYSSRSALARISGAIAAATGASDDRTAEVAIAMRDGRPAVDVRVATSASDSTPDAARRVADLLLGSIPEEQTVEIQIARIH